MKRILQSAAIIGSVFASTTIYADFHPYIGADYKNAFMKGKHSLREILPGSSPGATLYVGAKLNRIFGLEIGGEWSRPRTKLYTPLLFLGFASPNVSTKLKRSGMYADLVGYIPVASCVDVIVSLGYGWSVITTDITTINPNTGTPTFIHLRNKDGSVLRAGLGLTGMISENVGLRGKVGYETTGWTRLKPNPIYLPTKGYKDTITATVGAFFIW